MLSMLSILSKFSSVGNIKNTRNFFTIINQQECAFREYLGKDRIKLEPGIHLRLPFFHTITKVEMREMRQPIDKIIAYTKDNVPVLASGSLFYKINNPQKACYEVVNFVDAMYAVGISAMRAVIGQFEYDEIVRERAAINTSLNKTIGTSVDKWGIQCTNFEVSNFEPQNIEIARQLELQMEAERKRRENELNTLAIIRSAEGTKQTNILVSEGELIKKQNEANALKYTVEIETSIMSQQIHEIAKQFNGNTKFAAEFLLEKERLKHLQQMALTNNKVYFLDPVKTLPTLPSITPIVDMMQK
jgi:regulator of protease activity HflC (stomatin/prohibitin superfamily)